MRAIRSCFVQMLAYMRRDMMLFAIGIAPFLIGALFRFAIPPLEAVLTSWLGTGGVIAPYYALLDVFFSMLSPTMFCAVSAMISLEEADEKTAAYLFITPLGKRGYLTARFAVPSVIAFLVTVILFPVFKLTSLSLPNILLLAAAGTLQGMIVALLVLTIASNRLEGMAVMKLSSLIIVGAVIPFFVRHGVQYAISVLPPFWIGKTVAENEPLYMLPAFALSALWVGVLSRRYLRRI